MLRKSGRVLNKEWNVGAQHALYREDGTWYHFLKHFPGALFDAHGYVLFETEQDIDHCPGIVFSKEKNWLNAPTGIASLPGYRQYPGDPRSNS
jgi:5-methylcytosine-specific restriction protein A